MPLLFNTLSRFIVAFLPRSKHLLISWLQSRLQFLLEPKKIKSVCFPCFSIYLPWVMGMDAMALFFWMLSFMKPWRWCQMTRVIDNSRNLVLKLYTNPQEVWLFSSSIFPQKSYVVIQDFWVLHIILNKCQFIKLK